ncbi:MAG TPA: MFS transporter [Candidatus Baltobacteraceae bacterium]
MKNNVLRFVFLMGIVNLFADMVYEGGRGEVGALLGSLGASGFVVGAVAGGGELAGYAVRSIAGAIADRTGKYWIEIWAGYIINQLCVPALALAGSWPAAAGLVIGERFGRGVRRPATSGLIAEAGRQLGRRGWTFGVNEAMDQTGATIGPLLLAVGITHSGIRLGYGVLFIPAICTLIALAVAQTASRGLTPSVGRSTLLKDRATFKRYAIGGALVAAGYVDFALIAFRFARDNVVSIPAISIWFAVAMGVAAIASYFLGSWLDKYGSNVVVISLIITAAASPLAFLGTGALAQAGVVFWGLGTAVQDTLLVALVARVIGEKRATAFGIYDTVFGVAWFAGSALMGYLVDRSILTLVAFSVIAQLAAIPFFAGARTQEPSLH